MTTTSLLGRLALASLAVLLGPTGIAWAAALEPTDAGYWTVPADPLDLIVATDDARSASADFGTSGGTLSVTAEDGTQFTLVVPERALLATTEITMTPILGLETRKTSASSDSVFAVLIEPSGTQLLTPATLSIALAKPNEDVTPLPFAFDGRGEDASLVLAEPDSADMTLLIDHFSGYGSINWRYQAGQADDYDLANLLVDQIATKVAKKRLEAVTGRLLGMEREKVRQGTSNGAATYDIIEGAFEDWNEFVLKPALMAATNRGATCDDAKLAINFWYERERFAQNIGFDTSGTGVEMAAVDTALVSCRSEAFAHCVATGDYQALLIGYLIEKRAYEMGVIEDHTAVAQEEYEQMITRCAVYELKYKMTVSETTQDLYRQSAVLDGHVTIRASFTEHFPYGLTIEGVAEGESNPWAATAKCEVLRQWVAPDAQVEMTCSPGATPIAPAEARIKSLVLSGEKAGLLVLDFSPGVTEIPGYLTFTSKDGNTTSSDYPVLPELGYEDAYGLTDYYHTLRDWTPAGYPVMFRTTVNGKATVAVVAIDNQTEFELVHKPDVLLPPTAIPSTQPHRPEKRVRSPLRDIIRDTRA